MTSLKTILMSSAAALSLAAAAVAQETTTETDEGVEPPAQAMTERSFDDSYGEQFSALGDRNVEELLGTTVVNDDGEVIGEIDNFGLSGDQIVAIAGIGGFLGLGEHSVALPMERLTMQGDQLVLSGVTREELEAMPEYNEGDTSTFAADQTFRSGYETSPQTIGQTDTAAVQPSESEVADQPMTDVDEEVAEAEEAESDTQNTEMAETSETSDATADAEMAEGETAVEEAGEEMAQAAETAGETVEDTAEETAEATADVAESAADEAEETADAAEAEMSETADEMQAETGEADEAIDGETSLTASDETDAASGVDAPETDVASEGGWTDDMDSIFADIADSQIAELIGMEVASSDGEVVGEVDNFALDGESVVAIVGVGGFLGLGEHDVALSLDDMTYDGERLVLSSMTEEQLKEMPEYDEAEPNYLPQDGTLRTSYGE